MITYGKTIFATYTYSRDRLVDDAWASANNDFNRYIQKLRRFHDNEIQYLRTIEAHNDGFPHFHAILRFPTVLTIRNSKYVDRELYGRWKTLWGCGHSDYQIPRSRQKPIAYIIKYITKNSRVKIWKKYYQTNPNVTTAMNDAQTATTTTPSKTFAVTATGPLGCVLSPLEMTCKKHKIKQVTWSRKFFKQLHTN